MKFLVIKKSLIAFVLCFCLLLGLYIIPGSGSDNVASVFFGNTSGRRIPIYGVETEKKQIAISFDAAWGADKTADIMKILKEYDVGATFFLVGFWVKEYPEMVKQIDENGFEIGTHSNTHPDMAKLSEADIRLELETSVKLITDITQKDVKLFRAPFGSYNNTLINTAESLGLTTIQWTLDGLDWKGISAKDIVNRVVSKVSAGNIVLFHNNSDHIVEALPIILERLKMQGYTITCVGDLILKDNFTIDHAGVQKKL